VSPTKIFTVLHHDLQDNRPNHRVTVLGAFYDLEAAELSIKNHKMVDITAHWETWDERAERYQLDETLKKEWLGDLPEPTNLDAFATLWDNAGFPNDWYYEVVETELYDA